MKEQVRDSHLKRQWQTFLSVAFDPWVLVLGVATFLSGRAASGAFPTSVISTLTLFTSIASSLLGGRVMNRWSSLMETQVILARGQVAVRGLKLHLGNIADLRRRSKLFLTRCDRDTVLSANHFAVNMALEEIVDRCGLLQAQVVSSIENWTDIVPEAEIKTQIRKIARLTQENDEQLKEVERLQRELAESKNLTANVKSALRSELEKQTKELKETQKQLDESRTSVGFINVTSSALPARFTLSTHATCKRCGQVIRPESTSNVIDALCPDCAKIPQ